MMPLTIAYAQCNPTVGDVAGNQAHILRAYTQAQLQQADLLMVPELALCGYPCEDLVLRPAFQALAMDGALALAAQTKGNKTALLLGTLWAENGGVFNAALLCEDGEIKHIFRKHKLPNNGVFDDVRVFSAGAAPRAYHWRGHKLGVLICEDVWHPEASHALAADAPDVWLVMNASPFDIEKHPRRLAAARRTQALHPAPMLYLNQLGGQDEIVFEGASFALCADGSVTMQCPAFKEVLGTMTLQHGAWSASEQATYPAQHPAMWHAMMLGLRDYVHKSGFTDVMLGISGGIDSALTAAVAVDALGATRVHGVLLPSPYTSQESIEEARAICQNLGIDLKEIAIEPMMQAAEAALAPHFVGYTPDTTEENMQSRLRGVALMALSNKTGALLLTTGNKSEMAVGYATLYGDMCGAYNVLKDVYKTQVYALANWRNTTLPEGALGKAGIVVPPRTITRAPTAELRPNQTDQDSLPPYEELDAILQLLVEDAQPLQAIEHLGFTPATVQRVARLLKLAEYKRRQAPPGVKLTRKAFGKDWRFPLAARY